MLKRCFIVFSLVIGSAAVVTAAEDIMPMVPGADWQTAVATNTPPQLRKNMVKITLPSMAARSKPADAAPEARYSALGDIPGMVPAESLTAQPFAVAANDTWRHHVPEEMRFPMEPPLMPDRSIASNSAFNAMLDDLVGFDARPTVPAPVAVGQPERILGRPSLPMPSEILRNDPAHQAYVPTPVVQAAAFAPAVEEPAAITLTDFGGYNQTTPQSNLRTRRAQQGRAEPEGFTPMRNLKHAIGSR